MDRKRIVLIGIAAAVIIAAAAGIVLAVSPAVRQQVLGQAGSADAGNLTASGSSAHRIWSVRAQGRKLDYLP